MIHHPVILLPKLIVAIIIIAVLAVLRTMLTPEQFRIAVAVSISGFGFFMVVFWQLITRSMRKPDSWLSKMLVLNDKQRMDEGYRAASNEFEGLVGRHGETVSALRPSGVAIIEGKRVPVQTEGDFIPGGTKIEAVAVKGSRVLVQPADSAATHADV